MIDLRYLRMWWRYCQQSSQARRWLKANGDVKTAAYTMFHLNRIAQNGHSKHFIYDLKSRFVQWLYEAGYCESVSLQKQTMTCWGCGGSGEAFFGDEDCHKCGGTGIYRQHLLYRFVFNIDGRTYVWHQPRSSVQYSVQITELGLSEYGDRQRFYGALNREVSELYMTVMVEFLRTKGGGMVNLSHHVALRYAIRGTLRSGWIDITWGWRRWRLNLSYSRPARWWRNMRRLFHFIQTGEMGASPSVEDDIPF